MKIPPGTGKVVRVKYGAREVERTLRSAPTRCHSCFKVIPKGSWCWEVLRPISVITLTGQTRRGSVPLYECNKCAKDTP